MITIRWASGFVLSIIFTLWALGARNWILWGLGVVLVLVFFWTFREPRPAQRRSVSPYYDRQEGKR